MFEDAASIPPAAMGGQRDDVFNDPKGPGAARQVGNDREHAGCYESLPKFADDDMDIIARGKATKCLSGSIGGQFWIVRPQLTVEREDPGKIIRFGAANYCVHGVKSSGLPV